MILTEELRSQYQAVLKDLITRRSGHQKEANEHQRAIRELDPTIAGISKLLEGGVPLQGTLPLTAAPAPIPIRPTVASQGRRYATVSTRWAILDLLDRSDPMSPSDIADALLAEGIHTKAEKFANNVSAVLSDMKSPRGEVDSNGTKWEITERGRNAISHIRTTRRIMPAEIRDSVKTETPNAATLGASK